MPESKSLNDLCYFELSYKWRLGHTLFAYWSVHGYFLKLIQGKNRMVTSTIVTTSKVSCFPFVLGSCFSTNFMFTRVWLELTSKLT